MSKLTSTKRKVVYLKRSGSASNINPADKNEIMDDIQSPAAFDDFSNLDESFRSSDEHSAGGSSSARSSEVDRAVDKPDMANMAPEFQNSCTNASQKRVYQALCKHLILEIFFDINAFQIELISGISKNKITDLSKHIQS